MRIAKSWKLFLDTSKFTETDFEYLRGCSNRLETRLVEFPNLLNQYTKKPISTHTKIFVETVNEEQESMLLLKYEGEIRLISVMTLDEEFPSTLNTAFL